MKRIKINHTFMIVFLQWMALQFVFTITAAAQENEQVPDYFIKIKSKNKSLKENIGAAQQRFKKEYNGAKFWVGYQFDLREDIEFDEMYIHDEGGISISRGHRGRFYLREDDDLDTYILHALSELGDEKAKEALQKIKKAISQCGIADLGFFLQFDAKKLDITKVRLYYLFRKSKFEDYPVFWLGKMNTQQSFAYLTEMIENKNYPKKIIKPAIFVLSLHKHEKVLPLLTKIAGSDRYVEIKKSAAFWLGQIPGEESFAALEKLFAREKNREMKEKLVFSISQHESEKVIPRLAEIAKNDPDFKVREKAIFWLGQTDEEASLEPLLDILKNARDIKLKEKVVFSISQHKSERAAPVLIDVAKNDQSVAVRKKAIFWLGQMASKKSLQALEDIVQRDEETDVKTKAVFAISQHSDKDLAVKMLMDIARHNKNPQVRKKAIFWLGQSGDERAVDFFKEILTK